MSISRQREIELQRLASECCEIKRTLNECLDGAQCSSFEIMYENDTPLGIPVTFTVDLLSEYSEFTTVGDVVDMESLDEHTIKCKSGNSFYSEILSQANEQVREFYLSRGSAA